MTKDEQINRDHFKIRSWYLTSIKRYKAELPPDLYELVKKNLDKLLKEADGMHRKRDEKISDIVFMTNSYVLPWPVLVWYSQQPKR
jgi:hypothetical protein